MLRFSCIFFILLVFTTCGKPLDRAEILDRLRGLGIETDFLVTQVGETVNVTSYVALPRGKEASVEPFEDDREGPYVIAPLSSIEIDSDYTYEDYPGFRLMTFKSQVKVPESLDGASGFVLRYGFMVKTNDDLEYILARVLVAEEKVPSFTPSIEILEPKDQAQLKQTDELEIEAKVEGTEENMTYGWFVTGGEIKGRRDLKTTWKTPSSGSHSLVFTVRGEQAQVFSYKIIEVTIE